MHKVIEEQSWLGSVNIGAIELNAKSRGDIPAILMGLRAIPPFRHRQQHPPDRASPARSRAQAAAAGMTQTRRLNGAFPKIPAGRRAAIGGACAGPLQNRRVQSKSGRTAKNGD